ncbi:MAG TPA: hypothetical protein ENH59_05930 [Bacteroidetes bacterium]|nr:hypothetical protein [Bacteroidota bacterium]
MKQGIKTSISIFLAFLMLTSSCKFIKEKGWFGKSKADTMAVWLARQDSIRIADSVKSEEEKMKAIRQARLDSIQTAQQAQREWEERFKYHIIVGSFLTPESAGDYLDYYRSMGYNAQIIAGPENRFNLVSAEVHDNLNRALKRLYQYQDTVDFESWLYIKE